MEEVPSKSTDFQVEEPTEGNVTLKGQLANNTNTKQDSSITTSSELQDEDQQQQQPLVEEEEEKATGTQDEDQQQQQPLEEEEEKATKQLTKDEKKIKVSEICNDELDNDHDGIIDEEHDCLSRTSDGTSTSEKIVPELSTLGDDDDEKDEVKDQANKQTEKNSDQEQVTEDSKNSKNKNNNLIEEDRNIFRIFGS